MKSHGPWADAGRGVTCLRGRRQTRSQQRRLSRSRRSEHRQKAVLRQAGAELFQQPLNVIARQKHVAVADRYQRIGGFAPSFKNIIELWILADAFVADQYAAKGLGRGAGFGWYVADKDEPICTTMERLGTLPFVSQPGQAWVYGYNTDILGCVIERASGMPLDEFVRTRITAPLGMTDTYYFLPPAKRERLAALYMSDSANRAARAPDGPRGQGHYVDGPRRNFGGGAGIVSTARDYARFLQMLLDRGARGNVRILSPRSVELMSTNQTGTLYGDRGQGFGLGFATVDRLGADGYSSVGTFFWSGAYGTMYKVDPQERLVIVLMIQMLPNRSDVAAKFPTLVYQALVGAGRPSSH